MGGTAHLLNFRVVAGGADVVSAFNAARDEKYAEIIDKCEDFHGQVERSPERTTPPTRNWRGTRRTS
jgi:hypothetical protein